MIRFLLDTHSIRAAQVVEIWDDDKFLGALYPGDHADPNARAVRLISRHFASEPAFDRSPIVAAATARFNGSSPAASRFFTAPEVPGTLPLVLYFGNAADRRELVDMIRQAHPNLVAREI